LKGLKGIFDPGYQPSHWSWITL